MTKIAGSGSISQRHGSAYPDPDPYQNVIHGSATLLFREIIEGGKMAVLDCSPSALKILYNSNEFMPYVVFMAAPGLDEMRHIYENGKMAGAIMASQRTLNNFEKTSSIRRLVVPPLFSSSGLLKLNLNVHHLSSFNFYIVLRSPACVC
jgi:hypothetical protein